MATNLTEIRNNVLKWINNSLESQDINQLIDICDLKKYDNKYSLDNDIKQLVDTAFKQKLQSITQEKGLQYDSYENLLDLSILAARHETCSGNLPVMLLSDIFDCQTLDECQQLFLLVENKVDVWKEEVFFKNVKNQLLRSCNDLLRRLSRSQNTVFCGRILVFLARFFPLFERSGLNLISEFNQENATSFAVQEEGVLTESLIGESSSLEEGEMKETDKIQVDYNFYRKFWQLQEYFRNPVICYNRSNWKQFQSYCNDVLSAFNSFKLDPNSCANFQVFGIEDNCGDNENLYFAKYLTNQKLLELQLSDSNFRRFILIQFLILFQYLTSNVRFKQEIHTLSEEQNLWVKEITDKVYSLIVETPPNGQQVRNCIELILKREEFWSSWKNEGCPELKPITDNETEQRKNEANVKSTYNRKRKLGDELRAAANSNKILIGNMELNRIWNLYPDNWEACKSKKRLFTPTVEKFFENVLKADPEQRQEMCCDSNFCWRALRLLSQKSPHFFTPSNQVVKAVNNYLEGVVEKLSKDIASGTQKNNNDIAIDDAEDISDDELLKNNDEPSIGSVSTTPRINHDFGGETPNGVESGLSSAVILEVAEKIKDHWDKISPHFGFKEDELKYIDDTYSDQFDKTKNLLTFWTEQQDPEDVTLANLQLILDKAELGITIT